MIFNDLSLLLSLLDPNTMDVYISSSQKYVFIDVCLRCVSSQ